MYVRTYTRTHVRADGRTDGHLRLALLGRPCRRVDLILNDLANNAISDDLE